MLTKRLSLSDKGAEAGTGAGVISSIGRVLIGALRSDFAGIETVLAGEGWVD